MPLGEQRAAWNAGSRAATAGGIRIEVPDILVAVRIGVRIACQDIRRDVAGEGLERGGELAGRGVVLGCEDDAGALGELDGFGESPDADLGAGQVREDRDRLAKLVAGFPDPTDDLAVALGGSVGEIEAEDVDAGAGEGEDHVRRRGRRPNGSHDFGTQAHPLAQSPAGPTGA